MKLNIRTHFDSAHRLCDYNGPCANIHGHRWDVLCSFAFDQAALDHCGMACDFKIIKSIVNKVLPDHQMLNDVVRFNPTAENLAPWLATIISNALTGARNEFPDLIACPVRLVRLELFESPDCSIVWEDA